MSHQPSQHSSGNHEGFIPMCVACIETHSAIRKKTSFKGKVKRDVSSLATSTADRNKNKSLDKAVVTIKGLV